MESIKTLEQEFKYQESINNSEIRRGREEMIRGLNQVIENATELLKDINENTTDESLICNDRLHIWITQGSEQIVRGNLMWFNASRMNREVDFLKTLYEKEKVK